MQIHLDYNPTPKDHFFISAHLSDSQAISFDNTTKGHRIIRQALRETRPFPVGSKFTGEWQTLIIENGTFKNEYHVSWIDLDREDWLNGEIWETTAEQPISDELTTQLLHFSRLISDNYPNLARFSSEMAEFERLMATEVSRFLEIVQRDLHNPTRDADAKT